MPNQKQDTRVFDVGKMAMRKDTNRALPFHTTYDTESRQTEVKDSYNLTVGKYEYDGEGKRVKKTSNAETTVFVYDGSGQLAAEYSTALAAAPQVSYLTSDHLGSPRVITNQFGAVASRKDYNAFGDETLTAQRTSGLHYQPRETRQDYTGYQKDAESGLEYAQARYYNAGQGRFTSVDPLTGSGNISNPQSLNRYSYALNSPYKFTDPLGLAVIYGPMRIPSVHEHCKAEVGSCDGSDELIDGEADYNAGVKNTYDVMKANRFLAQGNKTAADEVVAANPNLQMVQIPPENPTNPNAPVPGSANLTTPSFNELKGSPDSTRGTEAAKKLLENTYGASAESKYNEMSLYDRAVFLNSVAAIYNAGGGILDKAQFAGFYKGDKNDARFSFSIILSGVTKQNLNDAELG